MLLSTDPIPRLDGYSDGIMDRPEEAGEGKSGGKRRRPRRREARCEIGNERKTRERERAKERDAKVSRNLGPQRGGIVSRGQRVNLVCIHASDIDEWTRLDEWTRTIIAFAFYSRHKTRGIIFTDERHQFSSSFIRVSPLPRRDIRYPSRPYHSRDNEKRNFPT